MLVEVSACLSQHMSSVHINRRTRMQQRHISSLAKLQVPVPARKLTMPPTDEVQMLSVVPGKLQSASVTTRTTNVLTVYILKHKAYISAAKQPLRHQCSSLNTLLKVKQKITIQFM